MHPYLLLLLIITLAPFQVAAQFTLQAHTYEVVRWQVEAQNRYSDPFKEVAVYALVTREGDKEPFRVPGFWAGGNLWEFRFSADRPGRYQFVTHCEAVADPGLEGKTGQILVTPYTGANPLYQRGSVQVSAEGNFLAHADGTPFFWLADSWWHGMTPRLPYPEGFVQLAADRKAKGFSVIQFVVGFPCDIVPFDPRGQNEAGDPWTPDFGTINPAYFDLADQRIETLLEMGLLPNIVGLWGYYMKWMGPEKVKQHWQYLIARYGAYPVTFTLSGETTLAYYDDLGENWETYKQQFRTQWSEVAAYIQAHDPYNRLLTTHPGPGIHDGKPPIYAMEHLDMVMLQSGHKGFETVKASNRFIRDYQERYPNKPVLHGEVCFEGMFGSSWADVQRLLFWSNVLQGTPGYSYGVEGIWQFNTRGQLFGPSPTGNTWGNVPWEEAMHYAGSAQLGLGATFLQQLRWWELQPAPDRLSYHATDTDIYQPYLAAGPSGDILVYFTKIGFQAGKLKLNGLLPDQAYQMQWFDPITGLRHAPQPFIPEKTGAWTVPVPPVMQDWVLYVWR